MNRMPLLIFSLLAASPGWGRPAAPTGRLVIPATQPFVTLSVNGQQLRLKVDLEAHGAVILNPEAAGRINLGEERGVTMQMGPVKLRGSRALSGFELEGAQWIGRLMWFPKKYVDDADGVIGPHHLPFAEVVFEGPGRASRAPFSLQARYTDDRGVFAPVRIAGKEVAVRFSLLRPRSFATGAAGALLAAQHSGTLQGEETQLHIGWGVFRPIRRLALSQPWVVGQFRFDDMLVRLRDFRGRSVLRSTETGVESTEIIVRGRSPRQAAERFLTVGLDQLQTCQSVTYSRVAKQLSFRC